MSAGSFCLVLHGHLPWVLHHARWPHGEDWLFEAASATWLPLLNVLDTLTEEGIRPGWTVGMMPILLEQLRSPRFTQGFVNWLTECEERAQHDIEHFERLGDGHRRYLAERHEQHYSAQRAQFESLGRDIPGAMGTHVHAGRIEILSSNATHGYHPLMLHDASARAQVRAGLAATERHFGVRAAGVWLPECAYRPAGPWMPPVIHGDTRDRDGVARIFADEGVKFFFVDTHLVKHARAVGYREDGALRAAEPDQGTWDIGRGWCSPLEPHEVAEREEATGLTVLARAPDASQQVWSSEHGYPGDGRYLEFHKREGMRGLRYWKVTGNKVDLGDKQPFRPEDALEAAASHADHFAELVASNLNEHRQATGRDGVLCAPFDAELYGHWWAEGPSFLLEVARRLHAREDVEMHTVSEALAAHPPDKVAAIPEGTWGANGDHSVWLHEGIRFYWEVAYRCEDRFLDLWHRADWRKNEEMRELLTEAGRQLMLLQASDWAFVITTEGAVDYGMRRILEHAARFDELCNGVEDALNGLPRDVVVAHSLATCRLKDAVFPDLDLEWWT